MTDYLDQFASTDNLLRAAQGNGFPSPAMGVAPPYQSAPIVSQPYIHIPLDEYTPPVLPKPNINNVISLVPKQQTQTVDHSVSPDHESILRELLRITKAKESSDNYIAVNPKSSASGAYQYTDSTWNNFGGYPKAALAPPAVQDAKFEQDLMERYSKYGNPYQTIAAHYLPALADEPSKWFKPFKVHGRVVKPVIDYIKYVVHDTPLEKGLHEYIAQQQNG